MARADLGIGEVLVFVAGIAVVVGSGIWSNGRARSLLDGWARDRGFEILSLEHCWFFRGPFSWTSGKQRVYRVRVRAGNGGVRNGYVRVGGWWFGLWSDDVEERWD